MWEGPGRNEVKTASEARNNREISSYRAFVEWHFLLEGETLCVGVDGACVILYFFLENFIFAEIDENLAQAIFSLFLADCYVYGTDSK